MADSTLLQQLALFNAKERFFLIGYALGNPAFKLSDEFRSALGKVIKVEIPEDAYCAMDYHLDWVYAALHVSQKGYEKPCERNKELVTGNQQDVDLLIAFEKDGTTHLILIEAKATGAWSNEQSRKKAGRLNAMFGVDGCEWPRVCPWYVLVSPRAPARLKLSGWPTWGRVGGGLPFHLALPMPKNIKRVTRWSRERDCAFAEGDHWKIVDR